MPSCCRSSLPRSSHLHPAASATATSLLAQQLPLLMFAAAVAHTSTPLPPSQPRSPQVDPTPRSSTELFRAQLPPAPSAAAQMITVYKMRLSPPLPAPHDVASALANAHGPLCTHKSSQSPPYPQILTAPSA
ncbi:hypothetical protein KC19_VG318100 [Ceratodon purpureus]|uniref:Uncharacterized protein n=1 Tax=Ceratodon purpureus TaxID=3225 RepID=A0A8T0HWD3_CERPU|nr:hypothetical protein KC19_VG318100 [Ceratodon purpureus]